ncbi:unnamed protein product [Mortierella alpina]
MKRSYAILLAAIAALALASTTCAVPMPQEDDSTQGVTTTQPLPDLRSQKCKLKAETERNKCIQEAIDDAKEDGEPLADNYAQECADTFNSEVAECDKLYKTSRS